MSVGTMDERRARVVVETAKSGASMSSELVAAARTFLKALDGADPLPGVLAPPSAETPPPPKGEEIIGPLMAKARELKIDTAAVAAYARDHQLDPTACFKAEIERIEQLARDQAILGGDFGSGATRMNTAEKPAQRSAPEKPRDDLLDRDRQALARVGVVI